MQQGQQRQHHATTTATLCLLPTHKTVSDPQPSEEQGAGSWERGAGRAMPSFRVALYFFAEQHKGALRGGGKGAYTTCHAPP